MRATEHINLKRDSCHPKCLRKYHLTNCNITRNTGKNVEELYGVRVDRQVVEPYVDTRSGCSYVLRCHDVPEEQQKFADGQLPDLPYRLVPARESTDLWCFGVMLYCMRSGGRPLFPNNIKSGHLLEHDDIINWSKEVARAVV